MIIKITPEHLEDLVYAIDDASENDTWPYEEIKGDSTFASAYYAGYYNGLRALETALEDFLVDEEK